MLSRGPGDPRAGSVAGRRLLGLGMIAGAVLLVLLATIRPDPFKDTQTIRAHFDSVQGLGSIDRNVRIGGANAGEIGTVTRSGDDVLVELEIEPDIPIHTDARAHLRPHTLFEGSAFVDLEPGSPSAPLLAELEVIPKSQTSVYTSLDEALRVLNEPNREALQGLVGSGAKVLRGEAITGARRTLEGAPELLRDLGPTARALRGPEGDELAGAIGGLADTTRAVASKEAELVPLARRAERTLSALSTDGGEALDATVAALPGPLEALADAGSDLTAVIERTEDLAVELQPAAEGLAPLLRDSRPLLRRATPVIEDATPLVAGLRTVLDRAARAAPALHDAVTALAPGARILDESVLPVLTADSRLGVPVYAQLTAAFTGGAAVARSYQTEAQNPLGAGHIIRVGGYFDPAGTIGGLAPPSCGLIAAINPEVARQLEAAGLCE